MGIFALSLSTIFIGVPLGNEGIAVQMGTALGRGSVCPFRKKHGEKAIREGDLLHVRYSTYDEDQTREELMAIVGEQVYNEAETDTI